MADKSEKRRLLGLDDGEPLPGFGKRKIRPPVTEDEIRERNLEDFRNEARSLLQQGRERNDLEREEARAAGRKAGIFSLFRKKRGDDEAEAAEELSEEEEWQRRMSAANETDNRDDEHDGS